jgi:hypothetical protein
MNERIQQLWWQAGGHLSQGNQHGWPHYTIDDPEKFAELIVGECISKLDDIGVIDRDSRTIAMKVISEHFGVEE